MQIEVLKDIERQVLWTACLMIHNANNLRPKEDEDVKVGGHQASSASMVSLLTTLYFDILRPEDRVAVKPHASPVFHAIQYLMGNQTREKLENFRGFGGAQSYPSRTKDIDDVDFSTGSVGLGVAITSFTSIVQDYLRAKGLGMDRPVGRMVALVGDAELDEGNIYECLQEGWKHDLRNTWWVIDYNRQSLDGVLHEGLWRRIEAIFKAFDWDVCVIRHGALQRAAFEETGGAALRDWIESCPNQLYSALAFQGGAAWRARLMDDLGDQGDFSALLKRRSDDELSVLMNNLGGHCPETLREVFAGINHDRPTVFLAYTIKGWGTPLAGHKDNHSGLMNPTQFAAFQAAMGVESGQEWDKFSAIRNKTAVQAALPKVPFFAQGPRRFAAPKLADLPTFEPVEKLISTQAAFGKLMDQIGKSDSAIASKILTTSPDVTVSTGLSAWANRRGLFARAPRADTFRDVRIPSTQKWAFAPEGQHIELGIAEMNLFLLLGAAGLSHSLFGERLLPVGTVYDPFVMRGLDALNYACYQDARFMIVGTPSGVTLAPEGGAHQSIATPLIGISQDGLASFEPAYADELAAIMAWGFDYMQRDGDAPKTGEWLRDATGGSVYLRLSTRPLHQIGWRNDAAFQAAVVEGGYWLREPGPNCEVVIAYQGCVAPQVLEVAGRIGQARRDIGVLAVTSADRLNAGWTAGQGHGQSRVERLLAGLPSHCHLVTVTDGHPLTLGWLGSVAGHRVTSLGTEHFGQTGTVADLHRHFGIDAAAILGAVDRATPGAPIA